MPKVEAFADDSCLQDISLPSISDSSFVFSDTDWPPATSHNQSLTFATESGPNSPRQSPVAEAASKKPHPVCATDTASYLIRVPPGFEQRFEQKPQQQSLADKPSPPPARSVDGGASGLHYEAVAVRVPREYDQQPAEFMAPAMQVIPLQVGRFVGDNQHDMDEMVRILRGASDWIDPTYIYVIDPYVRQFIWESLGTTVMNLFPDIQFMRQQLFMHLIQLHMGNAALAPNSDAKQQRPQQQQQQNIPVNPDIYQLAGSATNAPETHKLTPTDAAAIGIDRGSMNKCRQIDPYLALIQLAIYSEPAEQPAPDAWHRAAEDFALFGTMYSAEDGGTIDKEADQPAPLSLSAPGECHSSTILEKCEMLLQFRGYPGSSKPQSAATAPFPLTYGQPSGQYQCQPNRPVLSQTQLDFAGATMAPKQPGQFDYSAFVPLNKSSPLRRSSYFEQQSHQQLAAGSLPVQYNATAMASGCLQNAILQQQQQLQQQGSHQAARANLFAQFRLAKRQQHGAQYSMQPVANCGELARALQQYQQQQQQPTHFQLMQPQQQLHHHQLMHFDYRSRSVSDYSGGGAGTERPVAPQDTHPSNNAASGEKCSAEPLSGDSQAADN